MPKVDDIKQLQELVRERLEALEPGLTLLDTGAHLGGATMDLVALDARGSLTLIALAFVADDEIVLRALDAYSWCLECPDEVQKLYPAVRASSARTPRVLFVIERGSDGFFRKLRHLRFQQVECLEFHFGLTFRRIETPPPAPATDGARVTARPAPARARAEERPIAPVPLAVEPQGWTEEPRAPEAPSPGWQAAVSPPAGGVEESKVATVREYLQKDFPTFVIYDFYATDRGVQVFHLQDNQGAIVHSATVVEDLLNSCTEAQLRQFFDKHKLARVLRQAGQAGVLVTKSGLKIERR